MNRNDRLDKLYKEIPEINCKGLCHTTCGIIPCSEAEQARINEKLGIDFQQKQMDDIAKGNLTCPALVDKRCSIYEIRPTVCRLYGNVSKMKCMYGCTPKKYLPERKSRKLIKKIDAIKV